MSLRCRSSPGSTADLDAALDRHVRAVGLQSVLDRLPFFKADVAKAADWWSKTWRRWGLGAGPMATPGHPDGARPGRGRRGAALLFYGHYDVQPVDPVEMGDHDPFRPVPRGTRPTPARSIRGNAAPPTTRAS